MAKKKKPEPPRPAVVANAAVDRLAQRRSVTTAGDEAKDTMFVQDPITKAVVEVPTEEAKHKVLAEDYTPVDERTGEEIRTDELLRERSNALEAGVHSAVQAVVPTDFATDDPDALRAIRGMEEGSPWASGIGTVVGTLAPFAGPLKGAKLATLPGLADEAGQMLTKAVASESPGFLRQAGARVLGMAAEGGLYGAEQAAAQSHVDDSPLTAEKLAYGFMAGALPGAILGVPVGAIEAGVPSLARRFASRSERAREAMLKEGVTDLDGAAINERNGGAPMAGMLDEFQAAHLDFPGGAEELARAKSSPVMRQEMGPEGATMFDGSIADSAKAMDAMKDQDSALYGEWSGRMKREHIERMVPDDLVSSADVDDTVARAVDIGNPMRGGQAGGLADVVESTLGKDSAATAELKNALGADDPGLIKTIVKNGIEAQRPDVVAAVNKYLKSTPTNAELKAYLKKRPRVANDLGLEPYAPGIASNDNAIPFERPGGLPANSTGVANDAELLGRDGRVVANDAAANDNFISEKPIGEVPGGRVHGGNDNAQPWAWQRDSLKKVDQYAEDLEYFENKHRGYTGGKNGQIRNMRGLLAEVRDKVASGKRWEAARELDFLKKKLTRYAKPGEHLGIDDTFGSVARKWHEDLRLHLEDGRYWGDEFANMQQQINSAIHKRLSRAGSFWDTYFSDAGVPDPRNKWTNLKRADLAKIKSAAEDFNLPEHDIKYQMLQEHIKEGRQLNELMGKYFQTDRISAQQLKAWDDAAQQAEKSLARAKLLGMRQAQGKALAGGSITGGLGRATAGYLIGGPLGAAASMALNAAIHPGGLIRARTILERVLRTSEGRIARGVTKLITGKGPKLSFANFHVPSVGSTPTAARGAHAAVSLFSEKDPEKRAKAYTQTLGELADAASPGRAEAALAPLAPVNQFVPNAHALAAQRYRNAAQVVLQLAPVKPQLDPFGQSEPAYPSDDELQAFEDTYRGALDPISVLEAAADGEVTAEMVDAADLSAPELMTHIRGILMQSAAEEGSNISYDAKVQFSVIFKVPLDPSMTPEYINAMQTVHRARFEEGMGPRSRRTFDETGVNSGYDKKTMSHADKLESDEVIR